MVINYKLFIFVKAKRYQIQFGDTASKVESGGN